jgi:hypothetical protein
MYALMNMTKWDLCEMGQKVELLQSAREILHGRWNCLAITL